MTEIMELAKWPEMAELLETPQEMFLDELITWLGDEDPRRNAIATKLLVRLGGPILTRLVRVATDPDQPSALRLRILDVIEQIGLPLEPNDFFDLNFALRCKDRQLRSRIVRVITRLAGAKPKDPTTGGAASTTAVPTPPKPPAMP